MSHDDAAYESCACSPAALLRVHQVPGLVQELRSKGLCKVVAQVVTGARLRTTRSPYGERHGFEAGKNVTGPSQVLV